MMKYKKEYFILVLGVCLYISGCGGSENNASSPTPTPTIQTYNIQEIFQFTEPWALAELSDGRLLVTEKQGRLKLFNPNNRSVVDVMGIPLVAYGGQGGFGDVYLHPNFNQNNLLYLSYVESDPNNENLFGAVVIRGQLDLNGSVPELKNIQRVWVQTPKALVQQHYAHRISFDEHGKLWISSGERAEFTPAQDMNTNLGKIIRLNDDGSLPIDNPFQNIGNIARQIWTLGHRNPLGIAFDHHRQLWVVEMGPQGGDELNLIHRGENYGYPIVSEGVHYQWDSNRVPFLTHAQRPEFRAPEISWTPVISPSSLIFYKGSRFPLWKDKAIISGLGARGLVIVDTTRRPVKEVQRVSFNQRIRAVIESKDGNLWVIQDGSNANLYKIVP